MRKTGFHFFARRSSRPSPSFEAFADAKAPQDEGRSKTKTRNKLRQCATLILRCERAKLASLEGWIHAPQLTPPPTGGGVRF